MTLAYSQKTLSVSLELLGIFEEYPEIKLRSEKEPHLDITFLLKEHYKGEAEQVIVTVNGRQALIEWKISRNAEADALNNKAFACANEKKLNEAIDLWIETNKVHPVDPDNVFNIALAYYELGNYAKATKYCLETIRICPIYYRAFLNLGSIYSKNKQYKKAEEFLIKGLRFQNNNALALVNLGAIQSILQKYDDAIKAFDKAIAIFPKETRAYLGLGKIYYLRQDYDNAGRCFKAVLKLDSDGKLVEIAQKYLKSIPANPQPKHMVRTTEPKMAPDNDNNNNQSYSKGFQSFINSDYESAIAHYSNYLRQNPTDTDVWASLASCQLHIGDTQSANESIQRAIALNPKGTYYKQAAIIYDTCGMIDETVQAAQKAHDLGKNDSIILTLLGKCYLHTKNMHEAIKYFQEAIKLNPGNINARFQLAKVLKTSGQTEASKLQLEEIIWSKNASPLKEFAEKEMQSIV